MPVKVEKKPKEEKPELEVTPRPSKPKKINQMTLAEIEEKLKEVEEKMGGWDSKYAQQLIQRKNLLQSLK